MTRLILGLSRDSYNYIKDQIPRAIKGESIDSYRQIADIELSENVILKVYDNDIILDLGARRVSLEGIDFKAIQIG